MARVKERVNPMFAIEALIEHLPDRRFDGRFGFDGGLEGTGADNAYMQRQRFDEIFVTASGREGFSRAPSPAVARPRPSFPWREARPGCRSRLRARKGLRGSRPRTRSYPAGWPCGR